MFPQTRIYIIALTIIHVVGLLACTPPIDTATRLQIALENERRGEPIAAILELKNILQADPNNIETLTMVGRLSVEVGQSAEAITYLSRARSLGANADDVIWPLGQALLAQGEFEKLLDVFQLSSLPLDQRGNGLILHGEALLGLGRFNEAETAFTQASETPGSTAAGLTGLARVAMIRDRLDEAEKLIIAALDHDPFSVASFRVLGALRHKQQRYEEAEVAFVNAVEATSVRRTSGELLLARVGLAESQWRMGQFGKALGNVKDLMDAYPWHPLPLYLRALLAYDAGEYRLAADYLREVRLSVPQHRPSQQLLAASEFELGNFSRVELLLRKYLKAVPEDIEMRTLLARTHLRMGNPNGAMAALLPVVELAPDDAQFLSLLGKASLHSGDANLAAQYLERAKSNAPDDEDIAISLIVAQIGSSQIDKAEKSLAALPNTPEMQNARQLLGLVLLMRKAESERALLYAKQLRQATPANLHAMLALAELAESRGDPVRAMEWLEMARNRNPDSIEPRLLLVRYYSEREDHERAHEIAVEAVQIRPHKADALVALANEKIALGQTRQAQLTFEEALRASPESGSAYLGLSRAAVVRGDTDAARDFLARAVELDNRLMPRAVGLILELAHSNHRSQALALAGHLQTVAENLPYGYTAAGDLHMAEHRFAEALANYENAMKLSDDPIVALKSFIAAREAGSNSPDRLLKEWLTIHPDNESVRKMLAKAGATTPQQ